MQKIMFNDKYGLTKAVLEGKKTQSRRIIPESQLKNIEKFQEEFFNDTLDFLEGKELLEQYFLVEGRKKPRYAVGEVLAVAQSYETIYTEMSNRPKEDYYPTIFIKNIDSLVKTARSTKVADILKLQDHSEIIPFKATKPEIVTIKNHPNVYLEKVKSSVLQDFNQIFRDSPGWKNKMFIKTEFMPHQIRITNIRLQRLQDISDEDCLKEGIIEDFPGVQYSFPTEIGYCGQFPFDTPKAAYAALIDKVSGKGTWERNPWVFVYDFELVKK